MIGYVVIYWYTLFISAIRAMCTGSMFEVFFDKFAGDSSLLVSRVSKVESICLGESRSLPGVLSLLTL